MDQSPLYEVRLTPHAERDLDALPIGDYRRIDQRILSLAVNPRPRGTVKLGDLSYRVRVGNWRIIYIIDDANHIVLIRNVRRRGEGTYRNL